MTDLEPPSEPQWHLPPPELVLSSADVHVWRVPLEQPRARVRQLVQTLSDDERARAGRFHLERARRRFTVGRGVLRGIVGRYLGLKPGQVQFRYDPRGKPYLSEGSGDGALRFNLAHAHELALYAFTWGREVGVDLEYVHPMPEVTQIGTRFFSPRENAVLSTVPEGQRLEAFFHCWTRKEAYLKAIGEGLSRRLDQFDVSLFPGEPARLLHVEGDPQEAARWSIQALTPGVGYVAAIVVERQGWQMRYWDWKW